MKFINDIKEKIEEKKNQEEIEMNEEKKKMPKWLKVTLGAAGGAVALGGAYLLGKSKGYSGENVYDEEFEEEDSEDVEITEF